MEWITRLLTKNTPTSNQMTPQLATSLLHKADQFDGYRRSCEKDWMNRTAREGTSYRPWHDQSFAKEVTSKQSDIHCIILDPSADGGMPHTRAPNIVCIPAYYPKENLDTLLRHEMTHIYQRQNTYEWISKCEKEGWMHVEDTSAEREIPIEYRRRCRFNPDTLYARWMAWEGRYIPLPLFIREDAPKLRDVSIRWWDMRERRLLNDPPLSYRKRYGSTVSAAAQEHPFELMAYRVEHT